MAAIDRTGMRLVAGMDSWSKCLGCGGYLIELSRDARMIQARCEKCGEHTERYALPRRSSRKEAGA